MNFIHFNRMFDLRIFISNQFECDYLLVLVEYKQFDLVSDEIWPIGFYLFSIQVSHSMQTFSE